MLPYWQHLNRKIIVMHIISRKRLVKFWSEYPDAKEPLDVWYRMTQKARWKNLAETRQSYPHADLYKECTIFNIGGNKYRLISKIYYEDQTLLIRFVLTHPDYDREKWKDDCSC